MAKELDIDYHALNAMVNLYDNDGNLQLDKDKEAARQYFLQHINKNMQWFHSLEEKIDYLIDNGYWDSAVIERYGMETVKELFKYAYSFKFRFTSFLGAYKFYSSYAMKNNDGDRYLERFEDRVTMVALTLAEGDTEQAKEYIKEIISGRYQPATPTFSNAGKTRAGELVSCYLMDVDDNLESIMRTLTNAAQLSKIGGGVGVNLSNIRASGDPIKEYKNQSSGIVPVMKQLDDLSRYIDQLGNRAGAFAVYINALHMDILKALDTKKENADENIRIKSLSIGVVIPDIVFELAKNNEEMYLFSPYDVERVYGKPFSMVDKTAEYRNMVENPAIRKQKTNARKFFQYLSEIQFESGYPYIMFEDTVNKANPVHGTISYSNLCVTGDSYILTDSGYQRVEDLYNSQAEFDVVVDTRARDMDLASSGVSTETSTKMFKTAENAEIFKITTNEGYELRATEWHKMYVDRDGELIKIPLGEVVVGDKLLVVDYDGSFGDPTEDGKATVLSVEPDGVEDVYDVTVDNGNSVIFNGIATGNCSEILQVRTPSEFNEAGEYSTVGRDISCNLGSMDVARLVKSPDFGKSVGTAIRALTSVSDQSSINSVPTVKKANEDYHSVGLGHMNLHGFLMEHGVAYGSEEALNFVEHYFRAVAYYGIRESNRIAYERNETFFEFEKSKYADGSYFDRVYEHTVEPNSFTSSILGDVIPSLDDWKNLENSVKEYGLYHSYLFATAPTGSISYVKHATSSIHPVSSKLEIRKEGKIGRVYYPQYGLSQENFDQYQDAYEIGYEKLIDTYATAQRYVDQGMSLTLFFPDSATTRDLDRARLYAWRKGIKTIYYVRLRQQALSGTEVQDCVSCTV